MTTLRRRSAAALFFAALSGAMIAFLIFPVDMLLGAQRYWNSIAGDNGTSLIGFYALAHDRWSWPVLYTQLSNFPGGANIYYSDAIPVLAVFFKAIYKVSGILFPYFGLWLLLSYILMAVAAFLTLRELRVPVLASCLASLLFVLLPEFIFRYVHIGLVAQFFVVFAILFYLRFVRISSPSELILVCVAGGMITWINPYLLAMSSSLLLAGLLDAWFRGRITIKVAALCCGVLLSSILFCAFFAGLIEGGSLPTTGGFGIYSMNLLSPILPERSLLSFGPIFADSTGGQYEGFNYLGAGVILLVLIALCAGWRDISGIIKARPFLFLILVLFILFSLSNVIYAGPYKLISIPFHKLPIIDRITSTFRSSGRFFWPVAFCILFGSITILARRFRPAATLALVLAALVLQALDVFPQMKEVGRAASPRISSQSSFEELVKLSDVVLFEPGFLCSNRQDFQPILDIQLIAARLNRPFDGAYINRGDPLCVERAFQFEHQPFGANAERPLLIMMKRSISPARVLAATSRLRDAECRDLDVAFVCGKGEIAAKIAKMGTSITAPTIPLDQVLSPNINARPFLGYGWTPNTDGDFRWAEGKHVSIAGILPQPICRDIEFAVELIPLSFTDYFTDHASVNLNGGPEIPMQLSGRGRQTIRAVIPLAHCIDKLNLQIRFDNPKSPFEIGLNTDTRRLTWGVYNITIKCAVGAKEGLSTIPAECLAEMKMGNPIKFGVGDDGTRYLATGWHSPESWGVWGSELPIVKMNLKKRDYLLTATVGAFLPPGHEKRDFDVSVNGTKVATWGFTAEKSGGSRIANIPASAITEDMPTEISFVSTTPLISPKSLGLNSADTRRMGIGLQNILIENVARP
ncbi:MAG: hypothetical protein IJ935_17720 [Afipia sp.]|nr:hypothetical protein [Afipia sp.]